MKKLKMEQVSFMKTILKKSNLSTYKYILICALTLSAIFYSCIDNPVPDPLYPEEPHPSLSDRPTITDVLPNVEAGAGVREIQIRGTKLGIKNGTDTNWFFIGGVRPIYKQITDSLITIYRPNLSDDKYGSAIYFNITDPTFTGTSSSKEYIIQKPGAIVGDYSNVSTIGAIEFDQKENLYAAIQKGLLKTDSAGVTQSTVLNTINLVSSEYSFITDISFGPVDIKYRLGKSSRRSLFIVTGKNYVVHQPVFDTLNGTFKLPFKVTLPSAVSKMDFDENGNLYVGGNNGIYRIDTTVSTDTLPRTITDASLGYAGVNIKQIRIVKISNTNYIYVADSLNVWRSSLTNGSFTEKEQLVVTLNGTAYADSSNYINSIAIDVNGGIFLCLKNHKKYSLFILEGNGTVTPFYSDPAILPNTVEQLKWGNHNQLYLLSGSLTTAGRVYRLNLDRDGAAYNGRKFIK